MPRGVYERTKIRRGMHHTEETKQLLSGVTRRAWEEGKYANKPKKPRTPWRREFANQKCAARTRGIPFVLTFDEWLRIWKVSGHLDERGSRRGQYVMARIEDKGAYETGNVKIILCEENHREMKKPITCPHCGEAFRP